MATRPRLYSDTSAAAYRSIQYVAETMRQMVYRYIDEHGTATCDEIEEALGMHHATCSTRINELVAAGRLVDTGARRRTRSGRMARVLRVTRQV